ncbi:hypothetical protein ACFOWE_23555 [Planomonospora corallina]|uniref:Uncharacterized protein n=1 Tax=Planomonospora corallina TaxID=1806052 RepID=A0ABV8IDR8_9ACTN
MRGPGWEVLSWAEVLLPVVLTALLLRAPRRTTSLGIAAVCVVIAYRMLVVILPPGTDPVTGRPLNVDSPWPSIACYALAVVALLLAARSPSSPARRGTLLWAAATVAAAWTIGRLSLPGERSSSFGWIASAPAELLWKRPGGWSCKADADGLLIVLLALTAAAGTVMAVRSRRRVALGIAVLLVLAAFEGFVWILLIGGGRYLADATMMIRWHLLLAAVLLTASALRDRATSADTEDTHQP